MRLIDADALWDKILEHAKDGDVIYSIPPDFIDKAPTVDAEIVRYGKWVKKMYTYHCSECQTIGNPQWRRCPVCELKMVFEEKQSG